MRLSANDYSPVVLNMAIASLLCREPWTGKFTVKAYRQGFRKVLDLVERSEDEIFTLVPTSPGNRKRILAALHRVSRQVDYVSSPLSPSGTAAGGVSATAGSAASGGGK